jgi:anti-sigma factor RsiW
MSTTLPTELQELHAYVDNQLSPEARRRFESWLGTNPQARGRANDYEAIRFGLRKLYDPVLREPVPQRLRRRPRQWRRPLGALAAGVMLLLTGTWAGLHLRSGMLMPLAGTPHLVQEAAMAYAVYTPEVRHPVEVPGEQEQHLVAWLTKRLGGEVRAPRLDSLGFVLVGGRLLASDDGPGALFMYENLKGQRVVLYMCHSDKPGRQTAFRFSQHEAVSVFYWLDGPFSYALAAEIERSDLLSLAEAVYHQVVL